MVAGYSLYSGHFDSRVLHISQNPSLLTVFREPGHRLYSLYRHLRFTTLERQIGANHELAELARTCDFEQFLTKASRSNPGSVDNVYVRAFGGTLPVNRWERSADAEWIDNFGVPSEENWKVMIDRAVAVLQMPDVTILSFSRLSEDMDRFRSKIGEESAEPIRHLKNSLNISHETVGFSPIDIEPYASNDTLERLTQHDQHLMKIMGADF